MAVQFDYTTGSVTTPVFAAATARTIIQVTTDANHPPELMELSLALTAASGYTLVEMGTFATAGTGGTTLTARRHGQSIGSPGSVVMSMPTTEGGTFTVFWADLLLNPFSMPHVQYPLGREFFLPPSTVFAVRLTTSVATDSTHPALASISLEE